MNKEALFVTMALQAWETHVNRTEKLIQSLPEEQLLSEIAPGKNTGAYLVGHLIAIHDAMIALLGTGERSYAHLDAAFVHVDNTETDAHALADAIAEKPTVAGAL